MMNGKRWTIVVVYLLLVGAAAGFLKHVQSRHTLGKPGLKMVNRDVFDEEGWIVCTNTVDLPLRVLDFTSEPLPVTEEELGWLPKDTVYGRRRYTGKDGFKTQLSVVLMGTDRTSIHKPQICLTGQGFKIEEQELVSIPVTRPHRYDLPVMKITASTLLRQTNGEPIAVKGIYLYWFVCENRLTARHGERMWWMAKDLIMTGVLPRWAYVSYFHICMPGQEAAAFNRMKQLVTASVPEFQLVTGPESNSSKPLAAAALK